MLSQPYAAVTSRLAVRVGSSYIHSTITRSWLDRCRFAPLVTGSWEVVVRKSLMLVVLLGLALTAAAALAAPTSVPTKTPGVLTVGFDVPATGFWNGRVTGTTIKNPTGFEAQLVQAIAKNLGLAQIVYGGAPFGGLFSPSAKPYDFAMEEATITIPRAKVVTFSAPYFDENQGVLIPKGLAKPTSIAALKSLQL